MERASVAILGCGTMGTAILHALCRQRGEFWRIYACVRSEASARRVRHGLDDPGNRVTVKADRDGLARAAVASDVVILACAPQDFGSMAADIPRLHDKLCISLVAGLGIEQIACAFRHDPFDRTQNLGIARIMPSLGCRTGHGMTLVSKGSVAIDCKQSDNLCKLLDTMGSSVDVAEDQLDMATALGAACHALIIHAVDAATDAAVAEGLSRHAAAELAVKSFASASQLMSKEGGGHSPEQVKAAMSTPAGVTVHSYLQLSKNRVPYGIADATRETIKFAQQM